MWKPQLPLIVNIESIAKKGKQNNAYLFLYIDLRNKKSRLDKKEAELYNYNRSK